MRLCYRCKINMQKQVVVKDDIIQSVRFVCPACQGYEEEDNDISGSKYSAWSSLDIAKEG